MIDADIIVKDEAEVEFLKNKKGSVVRNAMLGGYHCD